MDTLPATADLIVLAVNGLRASIAATRDVLARHEIVAEPRHGCCAEPKLCKGHDPECRARSHPLGGVPWPCPEIANEARRWGVS